VSSAESLGLSRGHLEICRSQFFTAPGSFGQTEYPSIAQAAQQTERALPSLSDSLHDGSMLAGRMTVSVLNDANFTQPVKL
jgi:hypothetical protein